jgi:hypothetical protein
VGCSPIRHTYLCDDCPVHTCIHTYIYTYVCINIAPVQLARVLSIAEMWSPVAVWQVQHTECNYVYVYIHIYISLCVYFYIRIVIHRCLCMFMYAIMSACECCNNSPSDGDSYFISSLILIHRLIYVCIHIPIPTYTYYLCLAVCGTGPRAAPKHRRHEPEVHKRGAPPPCHTYILICIFMCIYICMSADHPLCPSLETRPEM